MRSIEILILFFLSLNSSGNSMASTLNKNSIAFSTTDKSSSSNFHDVTITHIHLDWNINFDSQTITGTAKLSFAVLANDVEEIVLDTRGLSIKSVKFGDTELSYSFGKKTALGLTLIIQIPQELRKKDSEFDVVVSYSTSQDATAIQWLSPSQTAGKIYPYVFTQGQAIHTRSLLPCMDSPGVKCTYTARVSCPPWCTALMSALPLPLQQGDEPGVFRFTQPVPVCSYLIALAAGQLESREISERVKVWAEPSVVDAAFSDFSQTEEFLQAAESLTCPYIWTRYDVLCLPPSFPYGGMENPCLTFATPTLLTGDKSLADVIAHEIAHSWTGNLITNRTWEHFWLNEGWTVWLERKIISKIYAGGIDNFLLSAQIGLEKLKSDIQLMGEKNPFTSLVWPLVEDTDPDDAFSSVPYEKGFNLLYFLEGLLGQEYFESFAQAYIQQFKFGFVTSGDFLDFLFQYVSTDESKLQAVQSLNWEEIFHSTGLGVVSDFSNSLSAAVAAVSRKWIDIAKAGTEITEDDAHPDDIKGWNAKQTCLFLESFRELESPLPATLLEAMDRLYAFTSSGNAEIKFQWYSLCVASEVDWVVPHVVKFVTSQGRMKFIRPTYRSLRRSKIGRQVAIDTFDTHKDMYHPIARKMVQIDFDNIQKEEANKTS